MPPTTGAGRAAGVHATPAERAVLVGLAALVAAVVLAQDRGVLTPDTKPEVFLAPWQTLRHTAAAWQDSPFLGAPNFNVGLAPVAAVLAGLDALGVPAWAGMRLWRVVLILGAAAGARRLAHRAADAGPAGRVGAAVLYAANPYLLLGGGTTPTLLPYAVLPWFLLALRAGFGQPRRFFWPCAAALLLTAMSGINAGVVPAMQGVAVLALVAEARLRFRRRWRDLGRVLATTAVASLLLAAYWLVPAVAALGVGAAIAGTTESVEVIAATSSPAEVVRGLGLWTLYGADGAGPFTPGLAGYLTSPLVVVASFAGPLLAAAGALASLSRARLLGVSLVAAAVPLMVGAYAGTGGRTPFGRVLGWALETVPGAVAFRTTNKAGAVLLLGLALLGALAVEAAWQALARAGRHGVTAAVCGLAALTLVVGTLPAWTGDLFGTRLAVPAYWTQAADALDAGDPVPGGSRVLFAPGTTLARYRWGYQGPDELGNALLARATTYRSAVPAGTVYAANLLAGTDQPLQDGTVDAGALSALARYVGAGDVLVRNDTAWEVAGGAAPSVVRAATAADPGLRLTAEFGAPGENTGAPPGTPAADPAADAALPPLQRFAVDGAAGPVRQVRAAGALLVDGDGAALPGLARTGALDGTPALLLAGGLDDEAVARTLDAGARVVLTDTNARRAVNPRRLGGGNGPLLPVDRDPDPTLALFGVDDQTVLVPDGDVAVEADGRGLLFGPFAYGAPGLAVDGDETTSWATGNFVTGVGQALVLRAADARPVPRVRLVLPAGGGPRVTRARVVVSGAGPARAAVVALPAPPARAVDVDLGTARGTHVRVEITAVTTAGVGPVGLAEVQVPGWAAGTAARLPARLPALLQRLAAAGGPAAGSLDRTPVDVLLTRRRGPVGAGQDEEAALSRDLTLPVARDYRAAARVRFADGVEDGVLDAWDPRPTSVAATASSRAARDLTARASSAVDLGADGDPDLGTAWTPADPVVGQWLEVATSAAGLDRVTVTQPPDAAGYAVRARVDVDGAPVAEMTLGPGAATVPLGGRRGSRVRLTLLSRAGSGPVRIGDVTVTPAGRRTPARPAPAGTAAGGPARGCVTVATLDDVPLRVRPTGRPADVVADLVAGRAVPAAGCGDDPLRLGAGVHRLRPVAGLALDGLDLSDTVGRSGAGTATGITPSTLPARVLEVADTTRRVQTVATGRPYWVVAGTGLDTRWQATADGVDLGPPVLVDGYSAGWLVVDGAAHDVRIRYGPVRRAAMAGAVSAAVLLGCLVVVVAGLVRRRRTG